MTPTIQRYSTKELPEELTIPHGEKYLIVEEGLHGGPANHASTITVQKGATLTYSMNILAVDDTRRRLTFRLEDDTHLDVLGIVLGRDDGKLRMTLNEEHVGTNATSRVVLHELARDRSTFDMQGTIVIPTGASGSDAYLEGRALLLSRDATANIVPSLEIAANDVKAGHAATAGPLDPDQLFYCESRGIDRPTAERMLVQGFVDHLLNKLPDDHQQTILKSSWRKELST